MHVYDLRSEVANARLEEGSRLVTPSGFSVQTHPERSSDLMEIQGPRGERGAFLHEVEFHDLQHPELGSVWHIDVSPARRGALAGVGSHDPTYFVEDFVRDLFVKMNDLVNAASPQWQPTRLIIRRG